MVVSLSHVEKEERRIYNEKMERDSSKIRCVIYDCDGVLFDSLEANRWFYSYVCEELGRHPLTEEEFIHAHTHTVHEALHHIFRGVPGMECQALEMLSRMDPEESVARLKMEPNLVPVLEGLRARGVLRAISTSRTTNMEHILKKFSLARLFDFVVTARDVQKPKPHPESIEKILNHFALGTQEAFFVGDSETDQKAALAAGVRFIAYKNRKIPAYACIRDHRALLDLL